ncbi:hypothetical protein HanRHA438_Chr12g0556811 [Helianthus annuus]|nr:hypothetical protein HanHA300_Chr12g0446931 [Helianthus annuus]KAJ0493621.1 hypothetical protein HanIR_Chr12g0588221 [Helianthus annuus]KAJ0505610.1 hypothetical protein HanHA89_Chr12g0472461 [Helianthus annuus]KAJ0675275.1 hypothetical protein HanLR1_Chr12g0449361 [Helianthus annuus]KAJ0866882.1 hypothetical protein HanRHA438_Chr12g0556811 [Helianthus annuus]
MHMIMFLIFCTFILLHINNFLILIMIMIQDHDFLLPHLKIFFQIFFDFIFIVKKFIFFISFLNIRFPRSTNTFNFNGIRSTSHQQQSILWWHTNTHSCFIFIPFNSITNNLQIIKHMSPFPNTFSIIILFFISNNQFNIFSTVLHRHQPLCHRCFLFSPARKQAAEL